MHDYGLKFTQLSLYALEIVKDMRSGMSSFIGGLGGASRKEGIVTMLIGDMVISRLVVYVHHVEEEKLRDREKYRTKKANIGKESGQQKDGSNRPKFKKQKGHAPSSASAPLPRNKGEHHGEISQNFSP